MTTSVLPRKPQKPHKQVQRIMRPALPQNQTQGSVFDNFTPFVEQEKLDKSRLGPQIDIIRRVDRLREKRKAARALGRDVALVPTMGALHNGHMSLIRNAARRVPEVYVSIYVNPTQFGANEDLASYPRTWKQDLETLRKLNQSMKEQEQYIGEVTTVFNPDTDTMYPGLPPTSEVDGHGSFVTITPLANVLEGASRPVFFRGVATVVTKLLNIVQPDEVVFGEKDIQQVLVIKRMIDDLHINTRLRIQSTEREHDGLAISSRNVYLGMRRRRVANVLNQALAASYEAWKRAKHERNQLVGPAVGVAKSLQMAQRALPPHERALFSIDYISLADPVTLKEIETVNPKRGAILSGAIIMLPLEQIQPGEDTGLGGGLTSVRLIDNRILARSRIFLESQEEIEILLGEESGLVADSLSI
ncbi:pantothenate synthase [Lambiella insularis]|nr:pantothenate synthase [Lambiella insularis]